MTAAPVPALPRERRDEAMTDVLTVGALGSVLLARWRVLVAFVVVGVGLGTTYGLLAPDSYTSKAVLFVIASPSDRDAVYPAAQFAEKRAATYPALLTAPEVLERTHDTLDLDLPASALIPMLTATNPTETSLVEVTATAGSPRLAQQLANTAADFLAQYAVDLEDGGTKGGAVTIEMAVPARAPQSSSSPSPVVLGALGGLAGGALGVVFALSAHAWRRRRTGGRPVASQAPTVSDDSRVPVDGSFLAPDERRFREATPATSPARSPRPSERPTGRHRDRDIGPAASEPVTPTPGRPSGDAVEPAEAPQDQQPSTTRRSPDAADGADPGDRAPWRAANPVPQADRPGRGVNLAGAPFRASEPRQGYAPSGRGRPPARRK
jgi:capsular polysaccharide biosynthesis protein